MGATPDTYRRGGEGMDVAFDIVESPLGRLLVAATDRGLCAVTIGDDDASLEQALRAEFHAARVCRDSTASLREYATVILGQLTGRAPHRDLPLDIRGTAFERMVWDEIRRIPFGETRTYTEIASSLGRPRAVRAVAKACAANRIAIAIPCHRVMGKDGTERGYRWGVERKRRLLAQERRSADGGG